MLRQLIAALGCVMPLAAVATADTIHVHSGDSIQVAINSASAGDEIVVHPGTYAERITPLGKAITLRSSDGPEVTIIDGAGAGPVIRCIIGEGLDTVIEGFTVTNGDAPVGGGMYNIGSSPTLADCTFSGNTAEEGGGMYNQNSSPTLSNCTFSGNTAERGGGMYNSDSNPMLSSCTFSGNTAERGGGMYNLDSSPTLSDCTFSENLATDSDSNRGGGMYNCNSSPSLTNCTFSRNSASGICLCYGGGMCNFYSSPTLTNCTFSGNTVWRDGGGMYNYYSSPTLDNCTFSGNSAGRNGGGMANSGTDGNAAMTNCILWGNTAATGPQIHDETHNVISATYSCIAGGWEGTGNIDADPGFVDPNGPDDDSKTWEDNDYHLAAGSPCIDAGDNTSVPADTLDLDGDGDTDEPLPFDLDGNPRLVDDLGTEDTGNGTPPIVDMGAYEATSSGSGGDDSPADQDDDDGDDAPDDGDGTSDDDGGDDAVDDVLEDVGGAACCPGAGALMLGLALVGLARTRRRR